MEGKKGQRFELLRSDGSQYLRDQTRDGTKTRARVAITDQCAATIAANAATNRARLIVIRPPESPQYPLVPHFCQ
jgi:hypothetical protein